MGEVINIRKDLPPNVANNAKSAPSTDAVSKLPSDVMFNAEVPVAVLTVLDDKKRQYVAHLIKGWCRTEHTFTFIMLTGEQGVMTRSSVHSVNLITAKDLGNEAFFHNV